MIKAAGYGLGWVSLSVVLGAGPLRAEGVAVPEGAASTTVRFQAGREPIAFVLHFDGGLKKSITVKPADVQQYTDNNNAKATTCDMPQAGFAFEGLSGIVDFVRPNAVNFVKARRQAIMQGWSNQPAIYGREYDLEFRRAGDGTEYYINSQYAGCEPASAGRLAKVDSPFGPDAFTFTEEAPDPRYHLLDVTRLNQPGLLTNAAVVFHGAPVPFRAPTGAALDLGATTNHLDLYPNYYGNSGYTGRNAFDHPTNSFMWTVPMRQYTHAWVLCAVADAPGRVPTLTTRLTRFVPSGRNGGRAYSALGDTTVTVSGTNAQQVGTVSVGGLTLPLWCVEVRLDLGKMIDLITDWKWAPHAAHGRGAFAMHYLDFELLGETFPHRQPFRDNRMYPNPARGSAVHVFGVTLERALADVHFKQTSWSKNKFNDDEPPAMKVAVTPVAPGGYTLTWRITDTDGRRVGGGRFTTDRAAETTVDLRQRELGWYGVVFQLRERGRSRLLVEHKASYVLLGPDTRQAGYSSPYIGWTFNGPHYTERQPEAAGLHLKKAGIRRATGLSRNPLWTTEQHWAPYRATEVLVHDLRNFPLKPDDEVRKAIADKLAKWPHADQVMVFWETYDGIGPYTQAPELIGGTPPPYDEARRKLVEERRAVVEQVGRVVRKDFPQLRVLLGNSLTCGELIAEVLRHKPPTNTFTHIGTEAGQRTTLPEKPNFPFTIMWSRQLRDTARALGYDYPVTCSAENICRKQDTIGVVNYAEWSVRDMLVMHAFGFEDIGGAGVGGSGAGNCYDATIYGGGPARMPYNYPEPAFASTATLTRVLDGVRFLRFVPTGSLTVYAAEFERPADRRWIYAVWAVRGTAELTVRLGSRRVERVGLYGQTTRGFAGFKRLKVTASTAAQYLLTDTPIRSIDCGARTYTDETSVPRAGFRVVDAVDSLSRWELAKERNRLVDDPGYFKYTYDIYRTLGKGSVREVEDPEKGRCLELEIESNGQLHKLMNEYVEIKLKEPIPIPGDIHSVGLWVKGNSGWGQIFWELEDAAGQRLVSSALGQYGNVMDYGGRLSINYDGWAFLSMPVTDRSPIRDLSTGDVGNIWSNNRRPKQPVKLTGLVFCAPAHPLYITEYKPCRQVIRVKDVAAMAE